MLKFKSLPSNPLYGGIQYKIKYDNGYGASIVQHDHSYGGHRGLWELAVMKNDKLCYTTPITDDVFGYLEEDEIDDILLRIQDLPKD